MIVKFSWLISLTIGFLYLDSSICGNTLIPETSRNEVTNYETYEKNSIQRYGNPSMTDLNAIVDRITRVETLVLNQQLLIEGYQHDVIEEMEVMRNATLLLLSIVSAKGSECQIIKDTKRKILNLHSALTDYDPFHRHHSVEEIKLATEKVSILEDPEHELLQILEMHPIAQSRIAPQENEDGFYDKISDANTTPRPVVPLIPVDIPEPTFREEIVNEIPPLDQSSMEDGDLVLEDLGKHKSRTSQLILSTKQSQPLKTTTTATTTTTSSTNITNPTLVCPGGSKAVGRECFSLHLEERHNWTSSRAFCRNLGGDLAEPNLFNNKLPKQLTKAWPILKKSRYWTFWVGATDQEREGEWHWVTGGILDIRQSSRWSLGEPPDLGEGQDCLAMILWVPGKFSRWDLLDDPCDLQWYVFCEYSKVI